MGRRTHIDTHCAKRRRAPGRRKQCRSGKVRFRDRLEAQIALARARVSDSPRRRETRYYLCEECRGYHLTSKP